LLPTFQIMDKTGKIVNQKYDPKLPKDLVLQIYSAMVKLNVMDNILYTSQRQGRLSFYMESRGEEAATVASSAALDPKDEIYAQYREQGALLWRGFSIQDMVDQCFGSEADPGKGRQMPVHYGSNKLHVQTISSPLATQLPQASGLAYALKREGRPNICICYFGEGAASEGDFHPAMNFAATLKCPVVFFCRNNGYAISTPVAEQYAGDGIGTRGPAYGIHTIRVDGNDMFAVYVATREARKIALQNKPVMIEAMTYRVGHHSTSDDSTRYRSAEEIEYWNTKESPIYRLRNYLYSQKWWDENKEKELRDKYWAEVMEALKAGEVKRKPPLSDLFTDVYAELPSHLAEQQRSLLAHIQKYPQEYHAALDEFAAEHHHEEKK